MAWSTSVCKLCCSLLHTSGVPAQYADNVLSCYMRRLSRMLNLFESKDMK